MHPEQAIKIVSDARGLAIPETTEQRLWVQRLLSEPSLPPAERYRYRLRRGLRLVSTSLTSAENAASNNSASSS